MISPGLSPSTTSTRPSWRWPMRTTRRSTMLSLTTKIRCRRPSPTTASSDTTTASFLTDDLEGDGEEHAGPQRLVGVRELGGEPDASGHGIDARVDHRHPALEDALAEGGRDRPDRLADLELRQDVLRDGEIEPDLGQVVERGDAHPGRHIGAERHRARPETAVERRPHDQVLEPGLGGLAPRLGGRDRALQRPHLGGEILDLGYGAGAGAVQRHRPIEPDLELVAQRGRAAGLGLGLLDVGAALVGVEPQQHVAEP